MNISSPKIIERKPHRPSEKPTEPNKHIPEIVPQKEKEKENFPTPDILEREPHRKLEKPTKLRP